MVLISCSKHIPNKSDCISDGAKNYSCPSPPTILKKNKPKETKVANVNVQVYKHFFEENYFPVNDEIPTGYIISSTDGASVITTPDLIYASMTKKSNDKFQKGSYLISSIEKTIYSDKEKKIVIGQMLNPTGEAEWVKNRGDLAILKVTKNFQEISTGNRLIPMKDVSSQLPEYAFNTSQEIKGKVIYILNEQYTASENSSVMLNIGSTDGVKNGMIVYIATEELIKPNPADIGSTIKVPGVPVATALIYRTTQKLSIALIINDKAAVFKNYNVSTNEI